MRFRHYDNLRVFVEVAQRGSISAAATSLSLTKGAISQQIKQLESELGFSVFDRLPRGVKLTKAGQQIFITAHGAFDDLEAQIAALQQPGPPSLTVGVTTYFASRWLSPHLSDFMQLRPDIRLRIQPTLNVADLKEEKVDIAIRWGNGKWNDATIEKLFACPAWPCGNARAMAMIDESGIQEAFENLTLLRDRKNSDAWSHWYETAGIPFTTPSDTLIIPDPNVRVQAVIDGQGIALNDALVSTEIAAGHLHRLSDVELPDYGYFLAYDSRPEMKPEVSVFVNWLSGLAQSL